MTLKLQTHGNPFIAKALNYLSFIAKMKIKNGFYNPPLTYTKAVFAKIMTKHQKLLPPESPLKYRQYKSVVVVGSGANLLNKNMQEWIDGHECVIRFNFAPTKGYEKDVGSKTTLRILEKSNMFKEFDNEILLHRYNDGKYFHEDLIKNNFTTHNLHILNHIFNNNTTQIGTVSSGFIGILLGFLLSSEILSVVGFDGVSPHYYQDTHPSHKFKIHGSQYKIEQYLIQKMIDTKMITYFIK